MKGTRVFDAISVHFSNGEYNVEEVHGNNQARQNEDQLKELSRPQKRTWQNWRKGI